MAIKKMYLKRYTKDLYSEIEFNIQFKFPIGTKKLEHRNIVFLIFVVKQTRKNKITLHRQNTRENIDICFFFF